MSNREAKLQARHWADEPSLLAEDLRTLIDWLRKNALTLPADPAHLQRGAMLVVHDSAQEAFQRTSLINRVLVEYKRMVTETQIPIDMVRAFVDAFKAAAECQQDVFVDGFSAAEQAVESIEKWAEHQAKKTAETPLRSEILKTTIEPFGDELLVRTDKDGSLKLRGTANIPMFMAFWRAPKHRLLLDAFLDIDSGATHTNLERHRSRLCAKLQDVDLEIIIDGNGLKMRKCPPR